MEYLVIADTHFGLRRASGATQESVQALETDKLALVKSYLLADDRPVIILGDLLDKSEVALSVLSAVGNMLRSVVAKKPVIILAGNHDISKDRSNLSGFAFLKQWIPAVRFVTEPELLEEGGGIYLVPHVSNQTLFDEAIADCASKQARCVLTHCNLANNFAKDQDHSINITLEQVARFDLVVTGHEHVGRKLQLKGLGLNARIPGSFMPCTPAEALGERSGFVFDSADLSIAEVALPPVEAVAVNWELSAEEKKQLQTCKGFITFTGQATAAQASSVLTGIAAFRKKSQAYMIANAVQIDGLGLDGDEDSGSGLSCESAWDLFIKLIPKAQIQRLKDLGYAHN